MTKSIVDNDFYLILLHVKKLKHEFYLFGEDLACFKYMYVCIQQHSNAL